MSVEGHVGTCIVPGSVDGDEFFNFIVNDIVCSLSLSNVLILDNCSIHKSELLREVVEAQGSVLLFLPAYSPDFNMIEESFSAGYSQLTMMYFQCLTWRIVSQGIGSEEIGDT
ncbi:hypothetical protein L208DRAFT_1440674 [Tricholoma matsutake]|nr:hypothetical protein L208DRAFT_1440674 [Tricholoma matsutake 945]